MNAFTAFSHPQKILSLFPQPQLTLVMEAMAAGTSPGIIWVDDADSPHSAFIWDRAHCYYCGGNTPNELFTNAIYSIIRSIVPQAIYNHFDIFKVYYTSDSWQDEIFTLFEKWKPEPKSRMFFTIDCHDALQKDDVSTDYSLHAIDNTLLQSSFHNREYVIEEIESCWHSLSQFLTHGFGFCLSHHHEIIAWCTAEYVSGMQCGIGIETLPSYRNQGCATVLASTFVNYCLHKGMNPHWDSWTDNIPSIRVAEKVGFTLTREYSVAFGSFIK
jgi:RimJ/RimL family protein N-acetyltransferase